MKSLAQNNSIKNWALEDRPREKMLDKGKDVLSDAELIAILISSGNSHESAVDLAKRILRDSNNNLIELSKLSINDLINYKGIGEAKAVSIVAALELGRRRRFAEEIEKTSISNSNDAFEYFYAHLADLTHEQFWIMLLNPANKIIKVERIGIGGINGTTADPKKIFKCAIENRATNIILCHNHPSGNLSPSEADKKITQNIIKAGNIMEIKILDHIIIGNNKYYSFTDEGII